MSRLDRLRNEARDLFEMVLVPGLAAVLPWPLCYRIFRRIARWNLLYTPECTAALHHATERGWVKGDPAAWLAACRLVTLVDHADYFLSRFRSDRWMARHLDVTGQWPAPGEAAILCTFHWGAGMWALRHAGSRGDTAHALVAPHVRENFPGRAVRYFYYGARNRENTRALGTEPIEATAIPRTILRALRSNQQVMAAVDVPSDQAAASEPITLIGMPARVPRGLFRIAAQAQVPMHVFITGIRMADGKRTLQIQKLQSADQLALMQEAFALLEAAIVSNPPAWHFWKIAPRFFTGGDAAPPG